MNPRIRTLRSKKPSELVSASDRMLALPEYKIMRRASKELSALNTEEICDRIDNKRAGIASLRDEVNELKEEKNRLIKNKASRSDVWEAESRLSRKEEVFNKLREDVRALNALLTLRKRD